MVFVNAQECNFDLQLNPKAVTCPLKQPSAPRYTPTAGRLFWDVVFVNTTKWQHSLPPLRYLYPLPDPRRQKARKRNEVTKGVTHLAKQRTKCNYFLDDTIHFALHVPLGSLVRGNPPTSSSSRLGLLSRRGRRRLVAAVGAPTRIRPVHTVRTGT